MVKRIEAPGIRCYHICRSTSQRSAAPPRWLAISRSEMTTGDGMLVLRPMRRLWRRFWWLYLRPRTLGERGELAAKTFLKSLGYVIIAHGARGPFGELDIIAVDGRTVVFVEVKTRRSHEAGHPAEAVDLRKRRRLTRLAIAYLKRHELLETRARFDIVAVTWSPHAKKPAIEHFQNAFEPTEPNSMFA